MNNVQCLLADLTNPEHAQATLFLLDSYSRDYMGGGTPLSEYTRANLIQSLLKKTESIFVFLAVLDGEFVGMAITIESFSTFYCKSLLNIHDFVVLPKCRRRGVGTSLLMFIEQFCRQRDYCKITLEVLEGNHPAKELYRSMGFQGYELDENTGSALFWQKTLE